MKYTITIFAALCAMLLTPRFAFSQGAVVVLDGSAIQLTNDCQPYNGSNGLPDGTPIQVRWDIDEDGAETTDPLLTVGAGVGQWNYNQILLNGNALLGWPGSFFSQTALTSNGRVLGTSAAIYQVRIFLAVMQPNNVDFLWNSLPVVINGGYNPPVKQDSLSGDWVCTAPSTVPGDHCSLPFVIDSLPFVDSLSTIGYSDDFHPFGNSSSDVIYSFVAQDSGMVEFSLCGSSFNTVIEVRTGGVCPGTTQVAENDDGCMVDSVLTTQSQVIVGVNAGQEYFVIADGYGSGSEGDVVFGAKCAKMCCGARGYDWYRCKDCWGDAYNEGVVRGIRIWWCSNTVTVLPDTLPIVVNGTTLELPDNLHSNGNTSPEVIFSFTPDTSGLYGLSSCGTEFNALLEVRTGGDMPGDTQLIMHDDDGCTGDTNDIWIQPTLEIELTAGTEYFIVVDGQGSNNAGNFVLEIMRLPRGDDCTSPIGIVGLPYCHSNNTLGHGSDYEPPCLPGNAEDMVFHYQPVNNHFASVQVVSNDPQFFPVLHVWAGCPPSGMLVCCDSTDNGVACCENMLLLTGVDYYIIVDGNDPASAGPFTLSMVRDVVCGPCPPSNCLYPYFDDIINDFSCETYDTLECLDTICARIDTPGDIDWFHIFVPPLPDCQQLTISVLANSTPGFYPYTRGLNSYIELYDNCTSGTPIAFDDDGGTGTDSRLVTACLTGGQYYHLKVRAQASWNVGPYILALNCEDCLCDTCLYPDCDIYAEPGNDVCLQDICVFECGDTLCGRIDPAYNPDWYWLNVPGPFCGRVSISVLGNTTPGFYPYGRGLAPSLGVYSQGCEFQEAFVNSSPSSDAMLFDLCLQPGLHYIQVSSNASNPLQAQGPYILAFSECTPCTCCTYPSKDYEPNAACDVGYAHPLVCGDFLCGEVEDFDSAGGAWDYYDLILNNGGPCIQVTIDVFGTNSPYDPYGRGLHPKVSLYDFTCNTLYNVDEHNGQWGDARISSCVPPGNYKVRVEGAVGSVGPYIIAVECGECVCPCPITCPPVLPPWSIVEGEPCPNFVDNYNGSCATADNHPFSCGIRSASVCGSFYAMNGQHDVDVYRVTVPAYQSLRWTVSAQAPFWMFIFKESTSSCVLEFPPCRWVQQPNVCQTKTIYSCCATVPQTFYCHLFPTAFNDVSCSDYLSTMSCRGCPRQVVINRHENLIRLNWPGSVDSTGGDTALVYRGTDPMALPGDSSWTIIGSTIDSTFDDSTALLLPGLKRFYMITYQEEDTSGFMLNSQLPQIQLDRLQFPEGLIWTQEQQKILDSPDAIRE